MQKMLWFACGLFIGLTALSISRASVAPMKNRVTDDTALYQRLSEIRVRKEAKIDFDSDIQYLAGQEKKYQDKKLPSLAQHSRLKGVIQRVSQQKYQYSGSKNSVSKRGKSLAVNTKAPAFSR